MASNLTLGILGGALRSSLTRALHSLLSRGPARPHDVTRRFIHTSAHSLQGRGCALAGSKEGTVARTLCHERLTAQIRVLDPDESCPCRHLVHEHVVGSFKSRADVLAFAKGCDVVTVEIEHVDCAVLAEVEAQGIAVRPAPATIATIQDKFRQKQHLAAHAVAVAEFCDCPSPADVEAAGERFGYPFVRRPLPLCAACSVADARTADAQVEAGGLRWAGQPRGADEGRRRRRVQEARSTEPIR